MLRELKVFRRSSKKNLKEENIRLLKQLKKFEEFNEKGERDLLLADLSELRNQLAQYLDVKFEQDQHSKSNFIADQENCLEDIPCSCSTKHAEQVLNLELEIGKLKSVVAEEKVRRIEAEKKAFLVETELSISKEELLQINKKYDATIVRAKLAEEKERDARSKMEHLEQQVYEISGLLANGNILLDDATQEAASIFDICSHKSLLY